MAVPSAESQLAFLRDVQAVLEDGQFVATYKFALLIALADLAVESGADDDASCPIALTAIAAKFVEYYWQQAGPYAGAARAEVLMQNTGRQASVVSLLAEARQEGASTLAQLRADPRRWRTTLVRIGRTIREQPLYRLQVVAGRPRPFLYPHVDDPAGIVLRPGVAHHLRRFHPLVTGLARDRWMAQIRRIPANLYAIGQTQDLEVFLFGADRLPIARHLPMLRARQRGFCLYCGGHLHEGDAHVDHFVPWSLHRFDAPPNLVAAHAHCNQAKRDMLAAEVHLERWMERNAQLPAVTDEPDPAEPDGLLPTRDAARRIAGWAYGRAFEIGAAAWLRGRQTEPLSGRFRALLRA